MIEPLPLLYICILYLVPMTLQQATVNPCLPHRLLDIHRQVWFSLLFGHCSFLLAPGSLAQGFFVPSKSLFPQSCGNPTGLQSQIPWGFFVCLLDLQVVKSVVGPRTFLTVWGFLGIIVLQFVGHLLRGSMVGLMVTSSKRTYATCCMTRFAVPRAPVPMASHGDPWLCRGCSNTQRQVWLNLCRVSGSWCTQDFVWAFRGSLVDMGFDYKHDFAPPTALLGFLFCPWMWGIFL